MILLPSRSILRISGADRKSFLQGIVTNDLDKLTSTNPLYAVMLNPQGKVLFDFILIEQGEEVWLDCWRARANELVQRLMMYRLRAKVTITTDDSLKVYAGTQHPAQGISFIDPRHPKLGSRTISAEALNETDEPAAYDVHRLTLGIPDSADFIPERSFPMEFGIADLHGISTMKGCYVGQEVVARSRMRGALHKALYQVTAASGTLPASGTPVMLGDVEIGQMRSSAGTIGLAVLRIEAVTKPLPLTAHLPEWFSLPINTQ